MFKITVEADTLGGIAEALYAMAGQFQTVAAAPEQKPATRGKAKKTAADLDPQRPPVGEQPQHEEPDDGEDAAVLAGLREQVTPEPETAKQLVDGGTGKPLDGDAKVVTMTAADVKTAAAKLVAKDQAKLAEILKKYGAAKISEVKPEQLGDFATDVVTALEGEGGLLD